MNGWKKLGRKIIYETKFLKLWEDTVEVADGVIFDDYSIVNFPESVVIVATDESGKLLIFEEYKYAIDEKILSFPAGGIEEGQTPIEAALRELLEETGYEATDAEIVGESCDYPSKLQHTDYIIRIRNAKKVTDTEHEVTETISNLQLISPDELHDLWITGKFKAGYMIAALAHTFPDKLIK